MSITIESFSPFLQQAWQKANFTAWTPIQLQAIPLIINGRDVIAQAPTGSGKTLAYVLPILQKLDPGKKDVQALLLAPSRELVMQIFQVVQTFTEGATIEAATLIGGADVKRQLEKLKKKPQVIIGTPGRVIELIKEKKLKVHEVKTIVIDEADQLMDPAHQPAIQGIIKSTLRDRQVLLFSATITSAVVNFGAMWLKEPVQITVKHEQKQDNVEHIYVVCERRDKQDVLRRLVKMEKMKAIAFVADGVNVEEFAGRLAYKGVAVGILHGAAEKTEREQVMKKLREGKIELLVATDLAARGLDIQGLTHVIHVDLPHQLESYVHRCGRVGRMGAKGTIIAIVTAGEEANLRKFANKLGVALQRKELFGGKMHETGGRLGRHSATTSRLTGESKKPESSTEKRLGVVRTSNPKGALSSNRNGRMNTSRKQK